MMGPHPGFHSFADKLRRHELVNRTRIEQLTAGAPSAPKNKKYVRIDTRIQNIVLQYEERADDGMGFLRAIAHNLS